MMDIKEAASTIKWAGLRDLHETIRTVGLTIMIQANYKNDDTKERGQLLDILTVDILRQAMGVCGGYNVFDAHIRGDENRELKSSLHCLHLIARSYFRVFSNLEDIDRNEDEIYNFVNFIDFRDADTYKEYADTIQTLDEDGDDIDENIILQDKYYKIIERLEKNKYSYDETLIYPHEYQEPDSYFESVS